MDRSFFILVLVAWTIYSLFSGYRRLYKRVESDQTQAAAPFSKAEKVSL